MGGSHKKGVPHGHVAEVCKPRNQGAHIDISRFTDPTTKNAHDLVAYAVQAWENGWGYVWGTTGKVMTEAALQSKLAQYSDNIGPYEDFIRANWLGRRTADCVGLIKDYYKDERRKRLLLSEQKEFRSVKNTVIQEAERLRLGEITVEEMPVGPVDEAEPQLRTFASSSRDFSAVVRWSERRE